MTQDASTEAKAAVAAKESLAPLPAAVAGSSQPEPVSQLGIPGEDLPKVVYRLDDAAKYNDNDILIIGGGDSAIHAALALSHAQRNRVTLSYRGDHFQRGPERKQQLIEAAEREKKIRILRKCSVAAITQDSVILDVDGNPAEIPNDKVFILLDGDAAVEFQSVEAAALK